MFPVIVLVCACVTLYLKNEMNFLILRIFTRQRRQSDKVLLLLMDVS